MHKFLRAAGFGALLTETDVYEFLRDKVIRPENLHTVIENAEGSKEAEYLLSVGKDIGIAADTITYPDGTGQIRYYYPFFCARDYSSEENCGLERHTDQETFAGLIDEYKLGISLIFYIQFSLEYKKYLRLNPPSDFKGTSLTAFANEGVVLLPVTKAGEADESFAMRKNEEERLLEAAMQGDQDAIETLTASDMHLYNEAADRIKTEDLYSVVEQSLMPSGIECDQYSIIGEIMSVEEAVNNVTGEELWQLSLVCNGVSLKLCMRKEDLLGEPLCGRRVKARIWLLGNLDLRRPV